MALRPSQITEFALALSLLLVCGFANGDGPDIRTMMTPEQFHAAGLDKLSPEEIDALNQWLVGYTVKDAPEVRKKDAVVQAEVKKVEADGIKTRIAGEFHGWDGKTIFRLENGQIWKQRLEGHWSYKADSPEVELRKNMLGYWIMTVLPGGQTIGVSRLE